MIYFVQKYRENNYFPTPPICTPTHSEIVGALLTDMFFRELSVPSPFLPIIIVLKQRTSQEHRGRMRVRRIWESVIWNGAWS